MKKRLSLLLTALMIFTMLPMSSFAAGVPKVVVQNVTTDDDDKSVFVSFEFAKTSTVEKLSAQKLRLELTNGAVFKKTGNTYDDVAVSWTGVNGGVVAGNVDVDDVQSGDQVNFKPVSDTLAFANIKDGLTITSGTGALGFAFKVDFSDASDGDVNFVVTDSSTPNVSQKEDSVGNQTVKIAVVKASSSADLSITVKDAEKAMSYDGGALSQFEVKNFKNMKDDDYLVISPDDDALAFTKDTKVYVDGKAITYQAAADATHYSIKDGSLVFHKDTVASGTKSVIVEPDFSVGRKATEGNVRVTVAAKYMDGGNEKTRMSERAVIGKVVNYNVSITVVEKNKKEIPSVWGGEEVTVTVTLKGPKGSILNRNIDFSVDGTNVKYVNGAAITKPSGAKINGTEGKKENGDPNGFFKDKEFYISEVGADREEVKFDITLVTDGDKDGVATITAAQRGWEAKADLAKIMPKFTAKADLSPVKKGEAKETANIVITEAKADLLEKGQKLTLKFDTDRGYVTFDSKDVKVEGTNGITFGKPAFKSGGKYTVIEIPVEKTSYKDPAVITISGVKVRVDGSSSDDVVKIKVGINEETVSSPEYIKVVKEYALESIKTVFTVGQTAYTVNGVEKAAASAPYVKNGRTMLPIRAVAESLGLTVQWNGSTKTASFSDATKVAAVVIGAEVMYVNGTPIPLAAKAELMNGTTFVELRSLATAFGVQIDWDAAAKQAIVSK